MKSKENVNYLRASRFDMNIVQKTSTDCQKSTSMEDFQLMTLGCDL